MKQADECLYNAKEAFKNFSYFKAIYLANKAMELAVDSFPYGFCFIRPRWDDVDVNYTKYIINKDKVMAEIELVNSDHDIIKSMIVAQGDKITRKANPQYCIEMPNGETKVIKNIEYLIEKITSNEICIRNITVNLPSLNIHINKKSFSK
jgi:hypothetical protein